MRQLTDAEIWGRLMARSTTTTLGCVEWTGSRKPAGYGKIRVNQREWMVHRLAYTLHHGPIPDGLYVCHRCDNPPCFNTEHLFVGTQRDNIRDASAKGRLQRPSGWDHPNIPRGERHSAAVLTWEQVDAMREMYATGEWTHAAIGEVFGLHREHIAQIIRGESWATKPDGSRVEGIVNLRRRTTDDTCRFGHPLAGNNPIIDKRHGTLRCRICHYAQARARYAERRKAVAQ